MNVPKLRFKEFKGDWTQTTLGMVSKNIMYGMNASAIAFDGKNKYIRITDIDDDNRTYLPSPLTSPSGKIEDKFKLQYWDIVFTRTGASVGKAYLYNPKDGNLFFAGFLVKFSITKNNPYFVFLQTLRSSYWSYVKATSMRSGQPGINAEEYKEFNFFIPSISEQTKIADFLITVDEKIAQLTQKCELLARYKKGVMQQLFSQELRFKDDDGRDFPDWEEKLFGDVFSFLNTNSFSRELLNYEDGKVKNIHYGDIHTKYKSNFNIEIERVPYINNDVDLSKVSTENYCKVGDLVIADASEDYNDI
ncbi:MAG: restriction endonuclease subunit S, partial [Dolichospermum sp.]